MQRAPEGLWILSLRQWRDTMPGFAVLDPRLFGNKYGRGNVAQCDVVLFAAAARSNVMINLAKVICIAGIGVLAAGAAMAWPFPPEDQGSIVIVFKDGHRHSIDMADLSRIDFKAPVTIVFKDGHQEKVASSDIAHIDFEEDSAAAAAAARRHFTGKWEVGVGNGETFFITLEADGEARKTRGEAHGTWTVVNGEARVSWDDGWKDAIRKVGAKHEKFAYEPGKSFDDSPSNVTDARNTNPRPI